MSVLRMFYGQRFICLRSSCTVRTFQSRQGLDLEHLAGDMKRAYQNLICQWIDYMQHLKISYPYLFSLALRTNPFDPTSKVEVAGK